MALNVRPLFDRVILTRIDPAEKVGRFYIPAQAQDQPCEGTIVAAGPGKHDDNGELIPMQVDIDDRVLFGKYAGSVVSIDGAKYTILKQNEILGIVDPKSDVSG